MPIAPSPSPASDPAQLSLSIVLKAIVGGVLMGLANLVPGISGGTMLLAAGVYPLFVRGVAEVTTLRFRLATLIPLGTIVVSAALALLLLAGTVKGLVVSHRWVMYSLFIGLTLGGVPIVWKLVRPAKRSTFAGAVVGLGLMVLLLFVDPGANQTDGHDYFWLFVAGLAGASAMVLPGVSGGYLLLVLGQYVAILGSIDRVKDALSSMDVSAGMEELHVVIPVGIGVVAGVVGVSNAVRWLLNRHPKPTLGFLLGLLVGAVLGLWPFQQGVEPKPGDVLKGRVLTQEMIDSEIEEEDYRTEFFSPNTSQVAASIGLIVLGFGLTLVIALIGNEKKPAAPSAQTEP